MSTWESVTRKGRARPPRGGGLGLGDLQRAGGSGGAVGGAGGNGGGAPHTRTKLKPSDTRANIYDRPNIVVMDGQEFSILPTEDKLLDFLHDIVMPEDLFDNHLASLFSDKSRRNFLIRMNDEASTTQPFWLYQTHWY